MPYSVRFDFEPPRDPDFVELRIWESATNGGSSWTLIETVTNIGTYPNYITEYETDQVQVVGHWFAIEWISAKGASTDLSNPIQGGTELLIGEVVSRMHMYDSSLDENVSYREAEAAIEELFSVDPYSVNVVGVSYKKIQGLVYLSLARAYIATLIVNEVAAASGGADDYTAGLVAQKASSASSSSSTQTRLDLLKYLLNMANSSLGKNYSVVAVMEAVQIAGGFSQVVSLDESRLLIEVE
jgi:hypothetical protein